MAIHVLLVKGLELGLAAAAPIGPVNVEIARRTLRFGRPAGFALGCGAVTVDVVYAIVTSVTLLPVLRYPTVTKVMSALAALFLAYLAFLCLKSARGGHAPVGAEGDPPTTEDVRSGGWRGHYRTGLLMTALNPMTLTFWFVAVPGAVAGPGRAAQLWPVAAGVFFGAFAWVVFFTWLVGHLRHFGGQRWLAWIDLAGGLTLLAFAVQAIWRLIHPPL
jgi:L-lysine exporter family protein LysE/ArgO